MASFRAAIRWDKYTAPILFSICIQLEMSGHFHASRNFHPNDMTFGKHWRRAYTRYVTPIQWDRGSRTFIGICDFDGKRGIRKKSIKFRTQRVYYKCDVALVRHYTDTGAHTHTSTSTTLVPLGIGVFACGQVTLIMAECALYSRGFAEFTLQL